MDNLFVGLMSGTSVDGIDVALVDFTQEPKVIAKHYVSYSNELRHKILSLLQKGEDEVQRLGELDVVLGREFASAINALLAKENIAASDVKAIGSHGQTIRHHPQQPHHFSIQIGDPNIIAVETGILTIADFRRKDIALGGQGAPLVPAFHQYALSNPDQSRAIVNIGGIANVTFLPKNNPDGILGFDSGPGNALLNAWIHLRAHKHYDENGTWAAEGTVHTGLLNILLEDTYFKAPPPKSTGREYFNLAWLQQRLWAANAEIAPVDVQATLTELTAVTIINAIKQYLAEGEILVCGGCISMKK